MGRPRKRKGSEEFLWVVLKKYVPKDRFPFVIGALLGSFFEPSILTGSWLLEIVLGLFNLSLRLSSLAEVL